MRADFARDLDAARLLLRGCEELECYIERDRIGVTRLRLKGAELAVRAHIRPIPADRCEDRLTGRGVRPELTREREILHRIGEGHTRQISSGRNTRALRRYLRPPSPFLLFCFFFTYPLSLIPFTFF